MSWSSPVVAAPAASPPPAAPARASGTRTVCVRVAPDGATTERRSDATARALTPRADPERALLRLIDRVPEAALAALRG